MMFHYEIHPAMPLNLSIDEQIEWLYHKSVLVEANQALAGSEGANVDDVLGQTIFDAWEANSPYGRKILKDFISQGYFLKMYEAFETNRYGRSIWSIYNVSNVIESNHLVRIWGTTIEITERKMAEIALQKSEKQFREIFNNSPIAIAQVDMNGHPILTNTSAQKMFGYSGEELAEMVFTDFTHPDDADIDMELFQQLVAGKSDHYTLEKRFIQKSGQEIVGNLTVSMIQDEKGNPIFALGMVEDITARKRAEEALQNQTVVLEQRLTEFENLAVLTTKLRSAYLREQIIPAVVDTVLELFQAQAVSLNTLDPESGDILLAYSKGEAGDVVSGQRIPKGQGLSHLVVETREIYINNDHVEAEERFIWTRKTPKPTALAGFPLMLGADVTGVLWVARDQPIRTQDVNVLTTIGEITASALHRASISESEIQRRQEAEMLVQATSSLTQILDLTTILEELLDYLEQVVPYDSSTIFLLVNDHVQGVATRGFNDPAEIVGQVFPSNDTLFPEIRTTRSTVILADAQNDSRFLGWGGTNYVRGWLGIPLISRDNVIGYITLDSLEVGKYTSHDATLAQAFANQAAAVIQNVRLFEQTQSHAAELEQRVVERTQELTALYQLTAILAADGPLHQRLEQSLMELLPAIQGSWAAIYLLVDANEMTLTASQGTVPDSVRDCEVITATSPLWAKIVDRDEPVILMDMSAATKSEYGFACFDNHHFIGIPIRAAGQSLGMLGVFYQMTSSPALESLTLLNLMADQIGNTVERLRLREQSEQAMILAERQRLARELHDSVTQSLYSLTFLAKAAQNFAESQDWAPAVANLANVQDTSLQALKEMRLLVFELLPVSFEEHGLAEMIRRRLTAVEHRAGMEVTFSAAGDTELPLTDQLDLYRLVQEALNNTLKHASASHISIELDTSLERVQLDIEDNGQGFDLETVAEGLGLGNMRTRAEKLGGQLSIISSPETGTRVSFVRSET